MEGSCMAKKRLGITSRIVVGPGRKKLWRIDADRSFPLPVIVDHMCMDPKSGELIWHIEATIDLIDGDPHLVKMQAFSPGGIDPSHMQRSFRWASPLEIIRHGVPVLLNRGIDPFEFELPLEGFPEAAELGSRVNDELSDAFLESIAREYLAGGRGYAKRIGIERGVSPRTVVSWVEKARQRGILSRVPQGSSGGTIIPKSKRR